MRGTALAMGIVGGVIGIITAFLEFTFGALGHALGAQGADTVGHLGFLAFLAAVVGIVGGALALRFRLLSSLMMLGACIAGFIAASAFWIVAGIFLFAGAALAFVAFLRRPKPAATLGAPSAE